MRALNMRGFERLASTLTWLCFEVGIGISMVVFFFFALALALEFIVLYPHLLWQTHDCVPP
ncbi:hypothetical protein DVH24_034425 [Malus domestica]|uniref:Uncharacterized protein n=1 Tax=Malus domestica TaxID=3750 RepID=A0A498IYX1_MALDO|nr:hypothetical protein DVH24_034425 [Malus domestica]